MKFESVLPKYPGYVEVPDLDDWSGVMFDDYQEIAVKLARAHEGSSGKLVRGYAAAAWLKKHGKWDIDGVSLDEFCGWLDNREAERTRLAFWWAGQWDDYFQQVIDPNG